MKKYVFEFLKRGICAMGFGPLVLAAVWGILYACGVLEVLTGVQVVFGIVGISLLVFVAAGITVVYQIDKLPLLYAMLINGVTLYIDYAAIYLVNGWLKEGIMPFIIFTIIFVAGYALIWGIVYLFIRKDIEKINRKIRKG